MSKLNFRRGDLAVSEEVIFYLKLDAAKTVEGTEASITLDQVADCRLRNQLTSENPEWPALWAEYEQAKQDAIKRYRAIEAKAYERK